MAASVRSISVIACMSLLVVTVSVSHAQSKASCTFTRFSLSNSAPKGINSYSTVVGELLSSNGSSSKGFTRFSNGGIAYFSAPDVNYSYLTARNDNGEDIGVYGNGGGTFEGFMLNGSGFTKIVDPNSGSPYGTRTTGINKWDTIVGYYATSSGTYHGFRRYSNGSYGNLDYPGGQFTQPNGINNNGMIVGSFSDAIGSHGFMFYNGSWAKLDYPGSTGTTQALGISDAGVVLGVNTVNEPATYFLDENGTFKVIDDSSASNFTVNGMAPNGLIVGVEAHGTNPSNNFIANCK
jgi:hypothetical protein